MSDRDAVDHRNNLRKRRKHRLRCNSSDRRLSREVVVRNNVKHGARSRNNHDRNRSNAGHSVSSGQVRLRLSVPHDR